MMPARTRRSAPPVFALAAAAALVLSGCGGNNAPAAAEDVGPLQKYIAGLFDPSGLNEEKLKETEKQRQELIAQCMQGQGFEYKPDLDSINFGAAAEDTPDFGSVEFAEQYGYGIVNNPYISMSSDTVHVDPNQEYVASLSPSEQQAYHEALSGTGFTEEELQDPERLGNTQLDASRRGCYGASDTAYESVQGGLLSVQQDPDFADLFKSIEAFVGSPQDLQQDSRIAELDKKWAACMSDAGHGEFKTSADTQLALLDEWDKLNGLHEQSEPEEAGTAQGPTGAPPSTLNPADTEKFVQREKTIAVADAKCNESTKYREEQNKIRFELEQKFVDEHKAKLDAMIAKYGVKQDGEKKSEK